jgi:Uri superfamily endonuclease
VRPPSAEALPDQPGAYILDLVLRRRAILAIAALGRPSLAPGRYFYAGSAWGPGGIRARVGRHLKRDKARRWHIDHLRARARVRAVVALPGARECDLVEILRALAELTVPVPGFGSSDCRRCPAHLLAAPTDLDLAEAIGTGLTLPSP